MAVAVAVANGGCCWCYCFETLVVAYDGGSCCDGDDYVAVAVAVDAAAVDAVAFVVDVAFPKYD